MPITFPRLPGTDVSGLRKRVFASGQCLPQLIDSAERGPCEGRITELHKSDRFIQSPGAAIFRAHSQSKRDRPERLFLLKIAKESAAYSPIARARLDKQLI